MWGARLAQIHEVAEQALDLPRRVLKAGPQPLGLRRKASGGPSKGNARQDTAERVLEFV